MMNQCCSMDTRNFFLLLMRVFFGAWLLYLGISKFLFIGPTGFSGYIVQEFANTWSPAPLNMLLAYLILISEPILGVWLLTGVQPRQAWTATALLMFTLMFGQTLLMKYEVVANNWQYLVLCAVCAAMSDPIKKA